MLMAEDLLLLLLDDDSGKLDTYVYIDTAIGGALLVELALGEHVTAVPQDKVLGYTPKAKIHPAGPPPSDPVLAEAQALVAEKERTAQDLVDRLGRKRRDPLLERLEGAGILHREQGKMLGLFPTTRWPAADTAHEDDLRRVLRDVLVTGASPDERTAALVSLLSALDHAHKVVDADRSETKAVKKRAKEIAEGDWAADAVKDAVGAANSAMVAVIATSASVAAASS